MSNYTIFLPKKTNNCKNENATLYQQTNKPYETAADLCRKQFKLLDGPPYANGEIHTGHIINKLLKQATTCSQKQLGKRSELKTNWDCHGLPIELGALKFEKHNKHTNFTCKIYALNWVKTQIAQLKLIGLNCYKPKTSMRASSQINVLTKLDELIKSKSLALGKKSIIWSLVENSSISENDITQRVAKIRLTNALNKITSRKQTKQTNNTTVLNIMLIRLNKRQKLLGKMLLSTRCPVWSLPWAIGVSIPTLDLKISNNQTVCASKNKLANATLTKTMSANTTRLLRVLNIFSGYNMLINNWQSDNIQTIDTTTKLPIAIKLTYARGPPLKYNLKHFKRSAFNKTSSLVGELFVINKLITHSLTAQCYTESYTELISTRSRGPAINWISKQFYIKLTKLAKTKITNTTKAIKFIPKACKALLTNLIQTRPDWTISRQRRWGVPLCVLTSASNKIMLDSKLKQRIKQLLTYNKGHKWLTLKTLHNKYTKTRWQQAADVVDVWFDASSTYSLRTNTQKWDLVIEGADQHRGWFQSMLINSALTTNTTPVRTIITHGFAMHNSNQKLSKSLQHLSTQTTLKKLTNLSANAIRIWACTLKPLENQIINANWLLKAKTTLLKISNTIKWLLGIVFEKAICLDVTPNAPAEKLALHKLKLYSNRIKTNYMAYKLENATSAILAACDSLSSMYFNIIKDQIYCDFTTTLPRQQSISVLKCIVRQIATWIAPILPSLSCDLFNKLKINNTIINRLPNNWFNKNTAARWAIINKLRLFTSMLRKNPINAPNLCLNIYVSNTNTLRVFKNINAPLTFDCAKTNIILTNCTGPTLATKISRSITISVAQINLKLCARCRRRLYPNEF